MKVTKNKRYGIRLKDSQKAKTLKVGQVIQILDFRYGNRVEGRSRYLPYRVIKVYEKEIDNMYLCENLITKTKASITGSDLFTIPGKTPTVIL